MLEHKICLVVRSRFRDEERQLFNLEQLVSPSNVPVRNLLDTGCFSKVTAYLLKQKKLGTKIALLAE
jgi:hypothetical protein